jgi:prepilin-type N-terminal cleavage/methylation domain-containing protein
MKSPRRRAFTIVELLIVFAIIAVIAGLMFSALRGGKQSVENLKIAQYVRGGTGRCAELKVKRLPESVFYVTWKAEENRQRIAFLTLKENGDFTYLPPPWPPIPQR